MNDTMSILEEKLREDPSLMERLDTEYRKLVSAGEAASDSDIFIKAVKNVLNIDISRADMDRMIAQRQELDLEELEAVSGGKDDPKLGTDEFCMADYACLVAFMHDLDRQKTDEVCLADYLCALIFK